MTTKTKKEEWNRHDRNFKRLFHQSAKKFIQLFYPNFYKDLDISGEWLTVSENPEDAATIFNNEAIDQFLDKAFLVNTLNGQSLVLHFEFQSTVGQGDFDKRVLHYNDRLSAIYKEREVISFGICFWEYPTSKAKSVERKSDFQKYWGLQTAKKVFDYEKIHLETIQWNDSKYYKEDEPNPVLIAFWGLMKHNKGTECIEIARKAYTGLAKIKKELDNAEIKVVLKFIGDYLERHLTKDQSNELKTWLSNLQKNKEKEEDIVALLDLIANEKVIEHEQKRIREEVISLFGKKGLDSISPLLDNIDDLKKLDDVYKTMVKTESFESTKRVLEK
ncbi:hypothetical protein ACQKK2_00620 [Bacillus paranthracis]|uniref:Transposase (putative) YhgA-like domain-containing protein n=1 Tax=Bacillus cereus (strain Q1) TaxID=361100 RepID=B9IZ96_BACCQ|nr:MULTISPECIES: hypothetical protein [Bacillus cereus group]ACM14735.1 hypothetical protein BCQ_4309 [Bacillus cereus Q1]MBY5227582.1 hypothetical protein [Bacillus paranthracis]MCY9249724.1 hypothetical protein [Bacillus paranthracis]MDA1499628.1 hypothetical protein [Bacillus cereus group sp. TH41-1LC]MDA1661225.1 hypothetical protein [Bacillus cereus group sp. TH153LC]